MSWSSQVRCWWHCRLHLGCVLCVSQPPSPRRSCRGPGAAHGTSCYRPSHVLHGSASDQSTQHHGEGRGGKPFFISSGLYQRVRSAPTFVFAGGRPSSNFLPFRIGFFFPPVDRLLCQLSRVIPTRKGRGMEGA